MLTIPVIYDETTKRITVSEEWAGTIIDDRSTMFTVSGIPSDAVSAKLDVKVAIKQSNKKTIRPFLILNGIETGTGTAVVPYELFYACKRDLKFIFQLEIMTEDETYASENWITMKVSPAIVRRPSQMPMWDQDKVLVDCYEVDNTKIVFRRFSGEEFAVLLADNPLEWDNIKNVPWRNQWTEGTPTDKEILTESFVHGELDKKTDVLQAIPEWDEDITYQFNSSVIADGKLYQSLMEGNKGHTPATSTEHWKPISSAGGEDMAFKTVIGDGTTKDFVLEHDLGTDFYCVNLIDATTGKNVSAEVVSVDSNRISVSFNTAPDVDGIRVFVIAGGGGGGSSTTTIRQAVPSDVWNIVHNKGRKTIIQVYDDNMIEMDAEIKQTTLNEATIRFYPTGNLKSGYVVII